MAFTDEQNEQIRKDLIREAQRCGITIGMRKTSVEQLTNSVGISKGSFYKFFDSKELLFFAVLEDIHTECFAAAQKSLQENTALLPADRAAAAILAACRMALAAATVRGLILTVSHQEQIGALYPQVLETLVRGACRELFE